MTDFSKELLGSQEKEQTRFEKSCKFYGISVEKGYELLLSGQWTKFVRRERTRRHRERKKLDKVSELEFKCPECERIIPELDKWCNHGRYCISCSQIIGGKVRDTGWRCEFCCKIRYEDHSIILGNRKICATCKNQIERLLK